MIARLIVYSVVVPQAVCDHGVDSVHVCAEGSELDLLWVLDQVGVRIAPRYGHLYVSCCLAEDCPSAWMKKVIMIGQDQKKTLEQCGAN